MNAPLQRVPCTIVTGFLGAAATTPRQRILVSSLQNLAADAREQKFEPPAIVVFGDIVSMRARLVGAARSSEREAQ